MVMTEKHMTTMSDDFSMDMSCLLWVFRTVWYFFVFHFY